MSAAARAATTLAVEPNRRVRVLVADDHPLFREGIVRSVKERPDLELVGEAADGIAGVELIAALRPAVAVVDLRLPSLDGFGVCARLRAEHPDLPTRMLVLSAFDEPEHVWQCLAHGAAGYVDKQVGPSEICEAIASVGVGVGFAERRSR